MVKLKAFPHLRHRAAKNQKAYWAMVRRVQRTPAFKTLQTVPKVGPVFIAGDIALMDTPHSFSRKKRLWAYVRLDNRCRKSDKIVYDNRCSKTQNPFSRQSARLTQ